MIMSRLLAISLASSGLTVVLNPVPTQFVTVPMCRRRWPVTWLVVRIYFSSGFPDVSVRIFSVAVLKLLRYY